MSTLDRIRRALFGGPTDGEAEPPPRHERREDGRERHRETGDPAWEEADRIEEPAGAGRKNSDAAPEILGGN